MAETISVNRSMKNKPDLQYRRKSSPGSTIHRMPSMFEVTDVIRKHTTTISTAKITSRTRFITKSQSMACGGGMKATSNGVRMATSSRAITSVKSHLAMWTEVRASIMYHSGVWSECTTLMPRAFSVFIVSLMLSFLLDFLRLPDGATALARLDSPAVNRPVASAILPPAMRRDPLSWPILGALGQRTAGVRFQKLSLQTRK